MKKMTESFNWNKIDWRKYPNGIQLYSQPIVGIKTPSLKRKTNLKVSFWNKKRWIDIN